MAFRGFGKLFYLSAGIICLALIPASCPAVAQGGGGSSSSGSSSSSPRMYAREKTPSLIDPEGPTVSLISAEPVFVMAAALNACGYNEGLPESDPVRRLVRQQMDQALTKSEDARARRDALCLYIAQHNMTGSEKDVSQYLSLALYLTPPPALEATAGLTELPPDATQIYEVLPLLRAFAAAIDLHGIWLAAHPAYDEEIDKLHDPLSRMITDTNLYLKMPAAAYTGRRFIVVVEPMLSPSTVNARIYGTDYVVIVSPVDGKIPMRDVRHTYLHYVIDPLLYLHSDALDREKPLLKEIRNAPLAYRYRSNALPLTIECLIKAIEARTMDTGIKPFTIPAGASRSALGRYESEREAAEKKIEAVRQAAVHHDMTQGFVLTEYFYNQMIQFEKSPVSLKDSIGEMVYGMDIDQQVRRARHIPFDQQADEEVLERDQPRQLTGLDLAEAKLSMGDVAAASAMASKALAQPGTTPEAKAEAARAHFILARADLLSVHPGEPEDQAEKTVADAIAQFQQTLATSTNLRLVSWSHIYLGRILDLECNRTAALAEYKQAMETRDGQVDTRLAAERGLKAPYAVNGHGCDDSGSASDNESGDSAAPPAASGAQSKTRQPQ